MQYIRDVSRSFSLRFYHVFYLQGLTHFTAIWTDLSRHLDEELTKVIAGTGGGFWKDQDQGAATMLVAAFDPALDDAKGVYLSDCQIATPADHARDESAAEKLWKLSEDLVGQKFEIGKEESRL